jgi:hypothetical protein
MAPGRLGVCRLDPDAPMPDWATGPFVSATRTPAELSIVCDESRVPAEVRREGGWRAIEVAGPLEFSLVGVLDSLTGPLARAGVSIFAMSTFDTDYLLVREVDLARAIAALREAGHTLTATP